ADEQADLRRGGPRAAAQRSESQRCPRHDAGGARHELDQEGPGHLRHAVRQSAGAMTGGAGRVADSTGNWVDGFAPAWTRPYLRLGPLAQPPRVLAFAHAM